jgi:small conductance mechanosensitive channel
VIGPEIRMHVDFEKLGDTIALYGLNALYAVVLLVIGCWCSRVAERWVRTMGQRVRHVDLMLLSFLASSVRYFILIIVAIAVLQLFGVPTTSLIAVLGAASLAVGLALQGTLSNLAAGLMLLWLRPFTIGDTIEAAGKTGTVRSLSLFMTELVASDNKQVLLPNSQVWGAPIMNGTTYPAMDRLELTFSAPAGRAAERLRKRAMTLLEADRRVYDKRAISVIFSKFVVGSDSAGVAEITVSAPVASAEVSIVKSFLLETLNSEFEELSREGISNRDGGEAT